jgi:hypothetical protein
LCEHFHKSSHLISYELVPPQNSGQRSYGAQKSYSGFYLS